MRGEAGAAIVMTAVLALAMGAQSSTAGAEEASIKVQSQNDASKFSYARLYCSPDHETHFAPLTAELAEQNFAPPAAPIYIGGPQPASSVIFAGFGSHWGAPDLVNHLYHPTPAIQFLTVAQGLFSITATDGETRELHAGDVVHLEDVAPCKGHITVVGDTVGFLVFARCSPAGRGSRDLMPQGARKTGVSKDDPVSARLLLNRPSRRAACGAAP